MIIAALAVARRGPESNSAVAGRSSDDGSNPDCVSDGERWQRVVVGSVIVVEQRQCREGVALAGESLLRRFSLFDTLLPRGDCRCGRCPQVDVKDFADPIAMIETWMDGCNGRIFVVIGSVQFTDAGEFPHIGKGVGFPVQFHPLRRHSAPTQHDQQEHVPHRRRHTHQKVNIV